RPTSVPKIKLRVALKIKPSDRKTSKTILRTGLMRTIPDINKRIPKGVIHKI
ncbi:unnamed protein product, partial [marine sediment metagenome]